MRLKAPHPPASAGPSLSPLTRGEGISPHIPSPRLRGEGRGEGPVRRLMDALYGFCVVVAGGALVLISVVIPWGVFTRYVLNSAASWPEPMAILLTSPDILRVGGLLSRRHAYERFGVGANPVAPIAANRRAILRGFGSAGWLVHGDLGCTTGQHDVAPVDCRISRIIGRDHLLADPGRRSHHVDVRRRAPADRTPAAGRRTGAALTPPGEWKS